MQAEEVAILFERMPTLDEAVPDEKTIGIYIACHGELIERKITGPRNVTIHKQNLGGYGCFSYKVREPSEHVRTALLLENELVGCSLKDYESIEHGKTDKHCIEIDKKGACERFSSKGGSWILKKYTYDATKRSFIIAFQRKTINMITCSRPELETFIGGDLTKYKKILDDFFKVRDTFFDTQLLFNIIYLFGKRGVKVANILDESCNVQFENKKRVAKGKVFSRGTSGYGGRRTRKNKTNRKN